MRSASKQFFGDDRMRDLSCLLWKSGNGRRKRSPGKVCWLASHVSHFIVQKPPLETQRRTYMWMIRGGTGSGAGGRTGCDTPPPPHEKVAGWKGG